MTPQDIAHNFLRMIVTGQIEEAYAQYTSSDFRHHNQYFKGDANSLKQGMIDNHINFPTKEYTPFQTIADGDKVVIHGLMKLNEHVQVAVVHIFKIVGDKIVEMRDVGQVLDENFPNENGVL